MKQSEAIRQALAELGTDASREDVEGWVRAKGITPTGTFASMLSQERRKLRESDPDTGPKPAPRERNVHVTPTEAPTRTTTTRAATNGPAPPPALSLEALTELRKLVGDDTATFKAWVGKVERAASLVGGIDQLRVFLDLWGGSR